MGSVRVRIPGQRDRSLLGGNGRHEHVRGRSAGHYGLLFKNHGHEQQPRLAESQRRAPAERGNRVLLGETHDDNV